MKKKHKHKAPAGLIKLDIGCGKAKKEGFIGIDSIAFPGVDIVHDVKVTPWPLADASVEEVSCSHFLEHLTGLQRVQFFNELWRVMTIGSKATIITPHWASNRAFGDFTHEWPPVSEMLYCYLSKPWRDQNAPHNDIEWNPKGYSCNFDSTGGYSLHPLVAQRNQEYQQYAITFYKEAASDTITTITRCPMPSK